MTTSVARSVPDYDDLPVIESLGIRNSWGLLPASIGTLSFLDDDSRRDAAQSVVTGECISLCLATDAFQPPLFGRPSIAHRIHETARNIFEDDLADFNPQSSSQWDGLLHIRAREFGWYGGVTELSEARAVLGVEHMAAFGIVGRGVLVDVPAARAAAGESWDPLAGDTIDALEIARILHRRNVSLRPGDILCVRLGWIEAYRAMAASVAVGLESVGDRFSGLASDDAMARFLWNERIAAVATDNPAVESAPGDARNGSLHRKLIPGLGMALGELFDLEVLADRCAASGRDTYFFAAAPLPLTGGTSSPANAMAIL